jgi:glutamyl-tRNA synthetase
MQYQEEGYLPEALVNYLARLGWSHGDEEKFSAEQLVEWFDLRHISKSPARFNPEKLTWLNQQYMKEADDERLADLTRPFMNARGIEAAGAPPLSRVVALLKERASTLAELADAAVYFYRPLEASEELKRQHLTADVQPALRELRERFAATDWERAKINEAIKGVVGAHKLKLPKIAMPLRVIVAGTAQTPSIDATLELIGKDAVLARMDKALQALGS